MISNIKKTCSNLFSVLKLSKRVRSRKIHVLGIESSCDDTGAAVVDDSGTILGEALFSQGRIHAECGGIIPNLADHLHRQHLKSVIESAMEQSKLDFKDLDAIAVTVKPGLILSLKAGFEYGKDLCILHKKPLVPIHHMEAHALTARMLNDVKFPFMVLLISGGHCILALVKSVTEFYNLGETLDNSPGEVLDKVARRAKLINLKKFQGLTGGALIEAVALEGDPTAVSFPFKLLPHKKNCNFSFSGLQTAAINHIKKREKAIQLDEVIPDVNDFCASFQWGMARHLCQRLEFAITYVEKKKLLQENEKCLVVSGGVASNRFIKNALKFVCDHYNYRLIAPPPKYCTDNGVMIAWNGIEKLKQNCPVVKTNELNTVQPLARCRFGEDISHDINAEIENCNMKKKVQLNMFLQIYEGERQHKEELK